MKDWKLQVGTTALSAINAGACCDAAVGSCTDDVPEAKCVGPTQIFTLGTMCMDLMPPCGEEPTGACCQESIGLCEDDLPDAECRCAECEWTEGATCAKLGCGGAIPTVSVWGLVTIALLLLVGGKICFGRRKAAA